MKFLKYTSLSLVLLTLCLLASNAFSSPRVHDLPNRYQFGLYVGKGPQENETMMFRVERQGITDMRMSIQTSCYNTNTHQTYTRMYVPTHTGTNPLSLPNFHSNPFSLAPFLFDDNYGHITVEGLHVSDGDREMLLSFKLHVGVTGSATIDLTLKPSENDHSYERCNATRSIEVRRTAVR